MKILHAKRLLCILCNSWRISHFSTFSASHAFLYVDWLPIVNIFFTNPFLPAIYKNIYPHKLLGIHTVIIMATYQYIDVHIRIEFWKTGITAGGENNILHNTLHPPWYDCTLH